jgi:hypothetical protein
MTEKLAELFDDNAPAGARGAAGPIRVSRRLQ